MAYPYTYYNDPSCGGADECGWQERRKQLKAERKRFRAETGCGGCYHSEPMMGLYACKIGETPGKAGYCGKWHDIRAKKKPEEI